MQRVYVLAVAVLLLVAPTAHAGLVGAKFDAVYYYQDATTPYSDATFSNPTFTVGPGVETMLDVEKLTQMSVDFTNDTLTIDYLSTTATPPKWGGFPINGPTFTLTPGTSPTSLGIVGFSIAGTTLAGFDAGRVTYDDTRISINWSDLTYAAGDKVVVTFAFVPEPSSIIALGVGCALPVVAGLRRRRRRTEA